MKKTALVLFAFIFALSLNITWAQDETNSSNVKKPDVTKPATLQKTTDVTKTKDLTPSIRTKKYNYTDTTSKHEYKLKPVGVTQSDDRYKDKKPSGIKTDVVTKGTGIPVNTLCMVSGEKIDPKITADYKGKTYAFCCKSCVKKFTKDPDKYVARFMKQSNKLN